MCLYHYYVFLSFNKQVNDTAGYECRAENEAGLDQIFYDLTVFGNLINDSIIVH